jgi:hypothetical protein
VTVPVRAGQYVLGVRASTRDLGALVEKAFPSRLVPEAQPPANFSLLSPSPNDWRSRPLCFLFDGHARRLRTASRRRLLDALWHRLDGYDVRASGSSLLLASTVLIRDEKAHVIPGAARSRALMKERMWARQGLELIDRPWVPLDTRAAAVTVPPSGLAWNGQLAKLLHAVPEQEQDDAPRPTGTFPIATWTVGSEDASLATRTMRGAGDLLDRTTHGAAAVHAISQLLHDIPQLDIDLGRTIEAGA